MCRELGALAKAVTWFERAQAAEPMSTSALNALAVVRGDSCGRPSPTQCPPSQTELSAHDPASPFAPLPCPWSLAFSFQVCVGPLGCRLLHSGASKSPPFREPRHCRAGGERCSPPSARLPPRRPHRAPHSGRQRRPQVAREPQHTPQRFSSASNTNVVCDSSAHQASQLVHAKFTLRWQSVSSPPPLPHPHGLALMPAFAA